jgi:hypothetical protein
MRKRSPQAGGCAINIPIGNKEYYSTATPYNTSKYNKLGAPKNSLGGCSNE